MDGSEAVRVLEAAGVRLFVGVPDSLMKGFCSALVTHRETSDHVVAANEGTAVAVAAGHYLATGTPAVVYMQNSGLGNAVNPLGSLTSRAVYGIPMLLMVGWRGEPGVDDEPQHRHQGSITVDQLELLDIPVEVIGPENDVRSALQEAVAKARSWSGPTAALVKKGTFSGGSAPSAGKGFTRMQVLETAVSELPPDTVFVATTGYTARELALLRERRSEPWDSDFLMVGSMGHASSIALGLAKGAPDRLVCCLDGDAAVAMHMGSLAAIAVEAPRNLVHVVINNGVHESVGGQPSVLRELEVADVAAGVGYARAVSVGNEQEFTSALQRARSKPDGPILIEARVVEGSETGLPRPSDFAQRMTDLMSWLNHG